MQSRTLRSAAVALLLAAAAASPAFAQKVFRIVVPFGPGAVQDTVARTFNNELGQVLGASVIVENRPGAGGTVGTAVVARATDNNTLVLAAASHNLAGHLYSKLAYDPVKDFTAVAYIGNSGYVIAAPGNLGVNTLADYVKLLKSKPGQMNYASAGNGSASHLGMAYFLAKAGAEMQHVPMKSTGDAVNEVLAGRVQGAVPAVIGITGFRQDPRIKLLAYTGAQRSRFLPDLPTVAEAGVPGYQNTIWQALLAPSRTPPALITRLHSQISAAAQMPDLRERLAADGTEALGSTPQEAARFIADEIARYTKVTKAIGLKID